MQVDMGEGKMHWPWKLNLFVHSLQMGKCLDAKRAQKLPDRQLTVTVGEVHKCQGLILARVRIGQSSKSPWFHSGQEFILVRGRLGQKWPERCIWGEFISARFCQRTNWPEVVMARGRSGQRSKWPEVVLARGRIGQRSKWPGVELARATRHSDVKASKTKVKRGTTGR